MQIEESCPQNGITQLPIVSMSPLLTVMEKMGRWVQENWVSTIPPTSQGQTAKRSLQPTAERTQQFSKQSLILFDELHGESAEGIFRKRDFHKSGRFQYVTIYLRALGEHDVAC